MSTIPSSLDDNPIFDDAYWLHQSPAVRALRGGKNGAEAITLATQGYIVDVPIMVWGWDPWHVMVLRSQFGYTWVPSALQPNIQTLPGLIPLPGMQPYDPNSPPPGSIKVSLNIADFPPFDPPVVTPPAVQPASYVGDHIIGNMYYALAGDPTPDGAVVTEKRGTFHKHKVPNPFGFASWYTLE